MKARKLICALLCIVMVFTLAVPAFAAKKTTSTFTDTKGNWAEHQIALVADAGIVGGYADGSFRPNANITREQFAKVVANFMGFTEEADVSQYTDVDPNGVLTPYVARCVAEGVMGGFSATRMAPKNPITREQAAAMLCRAFKLDTAGLKGNFTDRDKIAEKLRPEVAALELTGLITGYADGTFRPKANLTRAQMMVIISRLLPDNEGNFVTMSASAGGVTMPCEMMDDYTVRFFIPAAEVKADTVDFTVKMEKIPPIKGMTASMQNLINAFAQSEITQTVETGISDVFNPKELFPNAYDFNFSTLKMSVNGKIFTMNAYGKEAADGTTIVATPTNSAEADAAMQEAMDMNNISLNIFAVGNSVCLANGSYIQVGSEKVCFVDGYKGNLVLDMNMDEETITNAMLSALQLKTGVSGDGNQATIFLKSGSCITTDKGTMKLTKNITVTFNGLDADYDGILSQLAEADLTNITMLAGLVNEFIGNMEGHVVYVNMTIG